MILFTIMDHVMLHVLFTQLTKDGKNCSIISSVHGSNHYAYESYGNFLTCGNSDKRSRTNNYYRRSGNLKNKYQTSIPERAHRHMDQ